MYQNIPGGCIRLGYSLLGHGTDSPVYTGALGGYSYPAARTAEAPALRHCPAAFALRPLQDALHKKPAADHRVSRLCQVLQYPIANRLCDPILIVLLLESCFFLRIRQKPALYDHRRAGGTL